MRESGQVQLPNSVRTTEYDPGLQSRLKNSRILHQGGDKVNLESFVPHSKTRTLSVDSKEANRFQDFKSLCAPKTSLLFVFSLFSHSIYSFRPPLLLENSLFNQFSSSRYHSIFFRRYCQSSSYSSTILTQLTYQFSLVVSLISLWYKSYSFWYYSVFFFIYIRYEYLILIVSAGKTGVLEEMTMKIPFLFHSLVLLL